jgi:ABC-type multidrug transport system permease subunit
MTTELARTARIESPMNGLRHQFAITLKLHFRNRMALLYSYLFPTIFLAAFAVLYRHDRVPLARHLGELLTVTVLGGACFGLPTTMVGERERGVWRRYRVAPISTGSLVASTVIARYVLLVIAGMLQVSLAMTIGMPLPRHPIEFWLAFTFVAIAFLGLGLVIAMAADNVPAVQALGQCIFLPMLIIGGVAVQLASLPEWAQHVSAFFPGRYAVEALQVCVTGDGLRAARFNVMALLIIGASGCLAGAKMFRWDTQQRFAATAARGWVIMALASWLVVGILAESRDGVLVRIPPASENQHASTPAPAERSDSPAPGSPASSSTATAAAVQTQPPAARSPAIDEGRPPAASDRPREKREASIRSPRGTPARPAAVPPSSAGDTIRVEATGSAPWRAVTLKDIDRDLDFRRLPPDGGIVAPLAPENEEPDPEVVQQLEYIGNALSSWPPGKVADPVQRARNLLYVAAVPDLFQMEPLERHLPWVVFSRIQQEIPKDQLIQVLYWIALHPYEGDDAAVDQLPVLGLGNGPGDVAQTRDRAAFYAVKLLGRLTGKIGSP